MDSSAGSYDFLLQTPSESEDKAGPGPSMLAPCLRSTGTVLASLLTIWRSVENSAVAEHGDRTVVADGDHGGKRVVIAISPPRRVPSASECLDHLFGRNAGH